MAGLWSQWQQQDSPTYESFTILTTAANQAVSSVHDRMPVILRSEALDPWLDPSIEDVDVLDDVLKRQQNDELISYPVSTLVNKVAQRCTGMHRADRGDRAAQGVVRGLGKVRELASKWAICYILSVSNRAFPEERVLK